MLSYSQTYAKSQICRGKHFLTHNKDKIAVSQICRDKFIQVPCSHIHKCKLSQICRQVHSHTLQSDTQMQRARYVNTNIFRYPTFRYTRRGIYVDANIFRHPAVRYSIYISVRQQARSGALQLDAQTVRYANTNTFSRSTVYRRKTVRYTDANT